MEGKGRPLRLVKVTGRYSFAFTKASTGMVTDPRNGVMTDETMEVVP